MDANFALTYWCFDTATGDPWCGSMDVVVMSRQPPSGQGQSWPAELQPLLADLCVPWSEFVSLSSGKEERQTWFQLSCLYLQEKALS